MTRLLWISCVVFGLTAITNVNLEEGGHAFSRIYIVTRSADVAVGKQARASDARSKADRTADQLERDP
jgi:hypothetical protein